MGKSFSATVIISQMDEQRQNADRWTNYKKGYIRLSFPVLHLDIFAPQLILICLKRTEASKHLHILMDWITVKKISKMLITLKNRDPTASSSFVKIYWDFSSQLQKWGQSETTIIDWRQSSIAFHTALPTGGLSCYYTPDVIDSYPITLCSGIVWIENNHIDNPVMIQCPSTQGSCSSVQKQSMEETLRGHVTYSNHHFRDKTILFSATFDANSVRSSSSRSRRHTRDTICWHLCTRSASGKQQCRLREQEMTSLQQQKRNRKLR